MDEWRLSTKSQKKYFQRSIEKFMNMELSDVIYCFDETNETTKSLLFLE